MKVYISHAQADKTAADELAADLRADGFQVVHPDQDVFPGDNWPLKIGRALEESKAMVVLLSPKSVASPWVQKEIEYGITSRRFNGRLIPVMLHKTARYPWILKKLRVEPFDATVIARRLRKAEPFGKMISRPALLRHVA